MQRRHSYWPDEERMQTDGRIDGFSALYTYLVEDYFVNYVNN